MKGMIKLTKDEYLEQAFENFNAGRISAETYDAIVMNIDNFTEDTEEENDCDE